MTKLTSKGQATRERIVAAAAELIYAQGVAQTTTQDIERAAGVGSSQIFHYFGDKPALVRAVIDYQIERIIRLQEGLLAGDGGLAALQDWRNAVLAMASSSGGAGGCPMGSLAGELANTEATARTALVAGFARWEAAIHSVLRTMHEGGELRPEADPEQLAIALLTALQGGLLLSQTRRDTVALAAGLDAVLELIRRLCVTVQPSVSAS